MSDSDASVPGAETVRRALVFVAAGYRELEFWYPVLRLREAGLEVDILGAEADDTLRSELGYPVIPDGAISSGVGSHYDVVVVPGGSAGDALAADETAVKLLGSAASNGALVLTIGTGAALADAAGAKASKCADADGLPALMSELLAALVI
jgi:protease I